jgi:hypothetical protein
MEILPHSRHCDREQSDAGSNPLLINTTPVIASVEKQSSFKNHPSIALAKMDCRAAFSRSQ